MKIRINHQRNDSEGLLIDFQCQSGRAKGRWMQDPPKGLIQNIELDVKGSQIRAINKAQPVLETFDETLTGRLIGILEMPAENGIAIVRLGDTLLQIECGAFHNYPVGTQVEVTFQQLHLYDMQL